MNPKKIALLDCTQKENRKWLLKQINIICGKYNKTKSNVPKLYQMEKVYSILCKKTNIAISYVFSEPYIGHSLFDLSVVYNICMYNLNSKNPSKVRLMFRACSLFEMYTKTICILYSIYERRKNKKC